LRAAHASESCALSSGIGTENCFYQGALERRARRWLSEASTPAARAFRVLLVLSPLALAELLRVPVCPTAAFAHVPCPGCGLTRAAKALLHGDVDGAIAMNPLAPLVVPLLLGALAYATYRYVVHGRVEADRWGAGPLLVAVMVGLVAVWCARWLAFFGGPVPV
jgi:hypothetical protein